VADSITGTGTTQFFPIEPNWVTRPRSTVLMSRLIAKREGTVDEMNSITPDVPVKLDMGFSVFNKEEEYSIIDFFNDRKGMVERFWVVWPRQQFILNRLHTSGEATLECYGNFADLQYRGYERIEILMNNGDRIIREVTGTFGDADETSLQLDSGLDRDVGPGYYLRISRLLLVRFGSDLLDLRALTDHVGEIPFTFVELVNEYGDV